MSSDQALDFIGMLRKHIGEVTVIVDGQRWARLPDCDECEVYRFDKATGRFYHDRNCRHGKAAATE